MAASAAFVLLALLLPTSGHSEVYRLQSAYANLSSALGDCTASARQGGGEARLACGLGCEEHERVLEETMEQWWDHRMPWQSFKKACRLVRDGWSLYFMGMIVDGQVYYKCCSSPGGCNPSGIVDDVTELEVLLGLVRELVQEKALSNMVFLFNIGDQPLTDKTYWSPIPQFHWVRSAGHWTVPLPNPYHLKAHVSNELGDWADHEKDHVAWAEKIPKVFWRGSLSAPDHFLHEDVDTLPRVRLMNLAKQHPELFDVGITGIDSEMYAVSAMTTSAVKALMTRLGGTVKQVNMRKTMPRYRYVINVAAVLSAWRLVEMLATGSLLLLQDSSDNELILEWLNPWEHFVPVSPGLSDLVAKVKWLEENPGQAESIAANGFERFTQRIRRQDTYCYIWQAFRALANVQTPATAQELNQLRSKGGWKQVRPDKLVALPGYQPLPELLSSVQSSEL